MLDHISEKENPDSLPVSTSGTKRETIMKTKIELTNDEIDSLEGREFDVTQDGFSSSPSIAICRSSLKSLKYETQK